jgi:hypothetical protein
MEINFGKILQAKVKMEEFPLQWRFTDPQYYPPPKEIIEKIHPLDRDGARKANELSKQLLFQWSKEKTYETKQSYDIGELTGSELCPILSDFGISDSEMALLSWDESTASLATWGLFMRHFDHFFYPSSDDITITNEQFSWVVLVEHSAKISLGRKRTVRL